MIRVLFVLFAFIFSLFVFNDCFCLQKFNQNFKNVEGYRKSLEGGSGKFVCGDSVMLRTCKESGDIVRRERDFFNRYCRDCSSDVAILRYNFLRNKLTDYKDGVHAYIVFSPTYVVEKLRLNVDESFFNDVCFELQDHGGNICRLQACDRGLTYFNIPKHGDCAVINVLVKDRSKFSFEDGKFCVVRFFNNGSFDRKNMFFEFKVKAKKATYNLFSRLGEITDFYKEFAHPKEFNSDFYCFG